MSNSTITGNSNIVIQDVSESTITVNVNGEVQDIKNQLSELKDLLKSQHITNITYENKVYNIEHINEANFGMVTSKRVFNGVLIRELIQILQHKIKPSNFLSSLPTEDQDKWEQNREHLKDAQAILEESFVWVIGWELRRLFSIGNDKNKTTENKIDDYINHCFSTYRICLQLINYIFISKLWDAEIVNRGINSDKPSIRQFLTSRRKLKLRELRSLFQTFLSLFMESKLEIPLDENDLGDLSQYLQADSAFNKACIMLESLEEAQQNGQVYGLGHCHTAEISLATVLTTFKFYADYQLVTLKKVEYEEPRNSAASYIKDLRILENKDNNNMSLENKDINNMSRVLKYDNLPGPTFSVFFRNANKAINLFPFLLEYNALTNENDFQILFFECIEGNSDLKFFSIKSERPINISFNATAWQSREIRSDEEKNEIQKNLRFDMVIKQFELAMNTILDTQYKFLPKSQSFSADNLGNL